MGTTRTYSTTPCDNPECFDEDEVPNRHYHQIDGDDFIVKVEAD